MCAVLFINSNGIFLFFILFLLRATCKVRITQKKMRSLCFFIIFQKTQEISQLLGKTKNEKTKKKQQKQKNAKGTTQQKKD